MNKCSKCGKPTIKQLWWENGRNILKDVCTNPYCKENEEYNKNLEDFFKKILGGKI